MTRSYDEQLLLWDVRQLGSPMARAQLGGGVWRIRWLPEAESGAGSDSCTGQQPQLGDERPAAEVSSSPHSCSYLATASMHAGAHVLRLELDSLGSGSTGSSAIHNSML